MLSGIQLRFKRGKDRKYKHFYNIFGILNFKPNDQLDKNIDNKTEYGHRV